MKSKDKHNVEKKKVKKIILWEVNSFPAIEIKSNIRMHSYRAENIAAPETHSIKDGKGDNKFVITVAPQKLICPKGKT